MSTSSQIMTDAIFKEAIATSAADKVLLPCKDIHGTINHAAKVLRNRQIAVLSAVVISALTFSYYAISCANEGFAILWTLLMPLAICFADVLNV